MNRAFDYESEGYRFESCNLLEQDIDFKQIAFGAHFYDSLCNQNKLGCYLYPPESLSKNLILGEKIMVTPSSFNLTPIKEINFSYENL